MFSRWSSFFPAAEHNSALSDRWVFEAERFHRAPDQPSAARGSGTDGGGGGPLLFSRGPPPPPPAPEPRRRKALSQAVAFHVRRELKVEPSTYAGN